MAESVDALVSNTSRFTPVPVRPRLRVRREVLLDFSFFVVARGHTAALLLPKYIAAIRASSMSPTYLVRPSVVALA